MIVSNPPAMPRLAEDLWDLCTLHLFPVSPEEQSGDQLERPGEEPQGPEKPMVGMVNGTFRTLEEISVESSGKGAFALHNGTATNSQNRGPGPERPSVFGVLRKVRGIGGRVPVVPYKQPQCPIP